MNREYHVAVTGCDFSDGSKEHPFRTISRAAELAETGDKVIVHAGEYREWVKPAHSGTSEVSRITYEAAEGEHVVIKGSERIQNWEQVEGTVWKVVLPNQFFGSYNPYATPLGGDWYLYPEDGSVHPGEVYLNGKSFYEAKSLDEVKHPVRRETGYNPPWADHIEKILEPEQTIYQWCCETNEETTTIYANFQGADPNKELTEINVRKCCFYPERTGINYITVRGFEMAQAACPWTPPTADQPGLLGVNWSKGWIIENNVIHDAKCSGISIGKEASTGHNLFTRRHRKPGYQYQMEAVFRARQIGWSKEKIGSHVIRNNVIYDCGQNGIVGHLGCVFSKITGNHIYNINVKHEFFGYEIAGIKLHTAIDVQICHNNIHDCTLGTWLDWQAQGTRISKNLYYRNDRDFMIEVTHGPYLVDNNIFASDYNFDNVAQGGAYINNLCCGTMRRIKVPERSTPYHFPHTTEVAGTTVVYSGDDRVYNNIYVGNPTEAEGFTCGTVDYNGHPASYEEFLACAQAECEGNLEDYLINHPNQAVYIDSNAYLRGARGFDKEEHSFLSKADPQIKIVTEEGKTFLEITLEKGVFEITSSIKGTEDLGMPRITEAPFDGPNGEFLRIDTDYLDKNREGGLLTGPLSELKEGFNRIKIWG